jgi:hypothetical protein
MPQKVLALEYGKRFFSSCMKSGIRRLHFMMTEFSFRLKLESWAVLLMDFLLLRAFGENGAKEDYWVLKVGNQPSWRSHEAHEYSRSQSRGQLTSQLFWKTMKRISSFVCKGLVFEGTYGRGTLSWNIWTTAFRPSGHSINAQDHFKIPNIHYPRLRCTMDKN